MSQFFDGELIFTGNPKNVVFVYPPHLYYVLNATFLGQNEKHSFDVLTLLMEYVRLHITRNGQHRC